MHPKAILIAVLTIAAGIANAYFWREVIATGSTPSVSFSSLAVLSLFVFAILFGLAAAFVVPNWLRIATAIASLAAGYLVVPANAVTISAAGLAALGGWYAGGLIANEVVLGSHFSIRKIFRGGIPLFFTVVAFSLAVFYYALIVGANSSPSLLPKSLFDISVGILEGPLQGILPGFRSDASVDDLVLAFAARQIVGIDLSTLSATEREVLIRQGRVALSEQLGVKLNGSEKGVDILYDVTNVQVEKFVGPFKPYLPFIAAAGFFVAAKAVMLPVYWLTLILLFLVIHLLKSLGVLAERVETIEVKRLGL